MREDWAPRVPTATEQAPAAAWAAQRRAVLSAAYPKQRIVVPAGGLKVRSNDTDYVFRPHTAFAWLTGLGADREPDAVLVLEPLTGATARAATEAHGGHEAVLYFRPLAGRDTDEFFADARYGEFWVGARPTIEDLELELGLTARHIDELEAAVVQGRRRGHRPPRARRRPRAHRPARHRPGRERRRRGVPRRGRRRPGPRPLRPAPRQGRVRGRADARRRRRHEGRLRGDDRRAARGRRRPAAASAGSRAPSACTPATRATASATTRSAPPATTPTRCTGSRTPARSARASSSSSTPASRSTASTPPTSPARSRSTAPSPTRSARSTTPCSPPRRPASPP